MLLITPLQSRAFRKTLDELRPHILLQLAEQWGHGNRRRFILLAQCRGAPACQPSAALGLHRAWQSSLSYSCTAAGQGCMLIGLTAPQKICPACTGRAALLTSIVPKAPLAEGVLSTMEQRTDYRISLSSPAMCSCVSCCTTDFPAHGLVKQFRLSVFEIFSLPSASAVRKSRREAVM